MSRLFTWDDFTEQQKEILNDPSHLPKGFQYFHLFSLTFVASVLDINGCVLSYFEGTANLHCYTSCTRTTLHCSKV